MIRCPNCQHENSETAKFCENCGYNLHGASAPAPAAAPPVPPPDPALARLERLVPREFAQRLVASRSGQVERERRVVTILFSDVKGSTAMGEERDPEQVMDIMNRALDLLIEPVYRYEGTLARLMGDAILAFFGAPIAHEDDPERACLAALAMQANIQAYADELAQTQGIEHFGVRVGINTGLVVVGEVGSDLRVEYTAMGDAINVASRLENAAEVGSIVISENTARLVQHALDLEALGGLTLKGKSEPVNAYRVLGRRAVPTSARGIAGLTSPLVGRAREYATLDGAVQTVRAGKGGIVSLIGEAGLGKSRLLTEVRRAQTAVEGAPLYWLEGRSLSYETNAPNAPFIDLLSREFVFDPGDTDLERYDKLYNRVQTVVPGYADEIAPYLATLAGVELIGEPLDRVRYMMPPMLRGAIVKALLAYIGGLTAQAPTVLVFEDVHWSDASSLELIGALASLNTHVPLLLIVLMRPNKTDPAWQLHETLAAQYAKQYQTIELEPLDAGASRQLVANLLEIEDLPESVRALILAKAEGNPFYVEEVIRSLLDQKLVVREIDSTDGQSHWRATREIANIAIPDTLAGVITARLDRLNEEDKHTAQTAAVIGRNFSYDVLERVMDAPQFLAPSLTTLQARELVRRRTDELERAYLFKHALTQETAYNTLLKSRRTTLHKRVGETLEQVAPQNVDDIARHFADAGETARAAPYLLAAGDRAVRGFAIAEALSYYTRALDAAKATDNVTLTRRCYEGLGNALAFSNQVDRALELYHEMAEWGAAHQDVPIQVSAHNKTASILAMRRGQFAEADEAVTTAETLAEGVDDKLGLAEAYTIRCQICQSQADFAGTIRYMEQSVDIGRDLNIKAQMAFGLTHITSARTTMAEFQAAYETAQEALGIVLEIGDREHEADLYIEGFGMYHWSRGETRTAVEYLERGVEIASKINATYSVDFGNYFRGALAYEMGDYDTALVAFERAYAVAAPLREFMPFLLLLPLGGLTLTYTTLSPTLWERADTYANEALSILATPMGAPGAGTTYPELGFSALRRNNADEAHAFFVKGIETPSVFRILMRPRTLLGLAAAQTAQGQYADAERSLLDAREFMQAHSMKNWEALAALVAGQLAQAQGDTERALHEFSRGEYYASEMGFRTTLWQARAAAARVLDSLGQADQAAAKRAAAIATIDEIAADLGDAERREQFSKAAYAMI